MNSSLYKLCALVAATPFLVSAQETQVEPSEEDIVVLSPFEVADDAVEGYVTTSSIAGSRVAVPIIELASTTITLNENLIADTVAQDLRDTLNLVANVTHGNVGTGNQLSQEFSLRGYTVSNAQRDGLPSLMFNGNGGFDYSIVERMEITKGPAGVLYGSHNPGGVVSITSKMPLSEPMTRAELRVGSYGYYRGSIDHSGRSADNKFGYRISAAYWDWDGPADLPNEPGATFVVNPSLSYRFNSGLRVWGYYAHIDDQAANRRPNLTYAFGMRTPEHLGRPAVHEGIAENGETYSNLWANLSGVTIDSFEVGMEQTFSGDNFNGALRIVARTEQRESDGSRIRGTGGRNYLAANDVLIGTESRDLTLAQVDDELVRITRNASRWDDRGTDTDQDFIGADYTLNFPTGPIDHQLLTYVQYTDNENFDRERTTDVSFPTLPQSVLDANGWDNGRIEMWPNPTFAPITPEFMAEYGGSSIDRGSTVSSNKIFAWGLIDRMSFLEDRIILSGGLRYDSVEQFTSFSIESDPTTTDSETNDNAWSPKIGLIGKAYEGELGVLSLFYSYAETYTVETRIDTRLETQGLPLPNRTTSTNEFGAKVDMWQNRISGTFSIFDTEETNFLQSFRDDLDGTVTGVPAPPGSILGEPYLAPAGTRTTKGWEFDFALRPIDGLDMIVSYGDVDAEITAGRVQGVPSYTAAAFVRYEFREGFLSGFSAAWQYNEWGESEMNPAFAAPAADSAKLSGDSVHHLILGYRWQDWDVRLKVSNLFDDTIVRPSIFWTAVGLEPDRGYMLSVGRKF